jgi:hypothetical protein
MNGVRALHGTKLSITTNLRDLGIGPTWAAFRIDVVDAWQLHAVLSPRTGKTASR